MRCLAFIVLLLVSQLNVAGAAVTDPYAVAGSFAVLSYHETRDEVRDYPDPYAVDTAALVRQFAWLRGNGYTPVSLDQIIAAREGGKALPAKALLLSFDDAYLSFYSRVYPLLREFGFPAVLAVVGQWIDNPHGVSVLYGEKGSIPDASFPTWSQLREMADSGLVELASHTYDLHHGVAANPQGNLQPAATARIYDATSGRYEDDTSWRARIRADLVRNAQSIERHTGHRPRVVVWPYGSYNDELVHMAAESGSTVALTLDDGANTPDVPLTALRRILVEHDPALAEFIVELRGPRYPEPIRVVQLSLDDVYSADPAQQERNLSTLLDHLDVFKPTHVFLQATADTNGDGVADAAYFPNRHLPLRGDLFNRTAWQIASRVDAKVFAVMPVAAYRLPQLAIAEVYEDLARHASLDGLVFADSLPSDSLDDVAMLEFTHQLAKRVQAFRAPLKTVRTLTVEPAPASVSATAQNSKRFKAYAAAYDYVAVVATPASRQSMPGEVWTADPELRRKAIVMLRNDAQSTDLPGHDNLARQMRALQLGGDLNFGYIPSDFLHDNPPLSQITPAMSLRVYPQKQPAKER